MHSYFTIHNVARSAQRFVVLLLLCIGMIFPLYAQAVSIGITPALLSSQVEVHTVTYHTFTLTRSEPAEEVEYFDVSVSGPVQEIIDLGDNPTVQFNPGQDELHFNFAVDAFDKDIGNYGGRMHFTRQEPVEDQNTGLQILFSVAPDIHFEVVEDLVDVIDISQHQEAVDRILLVDLESNRTRYEPGEWAYINWTLRNNHNMALINVPYEVTLEKDGRVIGRYQRVESGSVPPAQDVSQLFPFELPGVGQYRFQIKLGDQTEIIEFAVHEPIELWQMLLLLGVLFGIGALVLGFLIEYREET